MQNIRFFLLVCFSLMLCSCSDHRFSDLFENGETVTRDYVLDGTFKVLELNDNVNMQLIHNESGLPNTKVEVTTGENIIDGITATLHGDTLTVCNENTLNWLRDYDFPLEMTIHYNSIKKIRFNSNGKLTSDTIHGYTTYSYDGDGHQTDSTSTLRLEINGGSGDIDLMVSCDDFHIRYEFGTSAVNVSGNAPIAYTYTSYNSHGPVNTKDLNTNIHYINSYGTNVVTAKAFHEIEANNYNNGIVYYLKYEEKRWSYVQHDSITIYCPEILTKIGNNILPIFE